MIFERTTNLALVRSILTDPEIWPHIGDDFAPAIADFHPNADPRICYVVAIEGCEVAGLFLLLPESPVCWEAHVSILPQFRGKVAHQAGREILAWIWANTDCQRIVAHVPESNPAAILYGLQAMGLKKFGVNEKSFMKNGRLCDQVLMGASRPEGT